MTSPGVTVEIAQESDLPRILALSNWAAEHTTANFATEPETLAERTAAWRSTFAAYPWLVARSPDQGVLGFAKGSPHRARGAYRWTAEVAVYVDPAAHGLRIGSALYARLIPTMRAQGYATLLAGIATPNPASERLHESIGFVRCGTYHRVGWKYGAWRDVGYWELHLQDSDVAPGTIRDVSEVWTG